MLLHDGEVCLPAMRQAIAAAEREVLLEMYWFGSDATGRAFAEALSEKARQGVRVCVTYDCVGSWETDRSMFAEMRRAGCEVFEYNPLRFWRPHWRIGNRRNHRKQLIVDGRVGLTGGVNLADPWASAAHGGGAFRDDMIRIEGPGVASMREIFAATFQAFPGARPLDPIEPSAPCGETRVAVLANDHRKHRKLIERAYLTAIRAARTRVLIENSYFIPGLLVRYALGRAVQRKVEVRVVLPLESDVPAVSYATRRLYGALLRRGIRLYEWGRNVLHSKTAVIDDTCMVGTHNLDYRSWLYNLEINVSVDDPNIAAQLAQRIERDIAESVQVDARVWRYRPLLERLLEEFFYRFRRLL
ncbi:MAG TPA: phospholipase D-like domain-containing protein [Polyangiales bacterium]|nr:phospholipase D-like domain-containing protein [Polyangiales bacterium]